MRRVQGFRDLVCRDPWAASRRHSQSARRERAQARVRQDRVASMPTRGKPARDVNTDYSVILVRLHIGERATRRKISRTAHATASRQATMSKTAAYYDSAHTASPELYDPPFHAPQDDLYDIYAVLRRDYPAYYNRQRDVWCLTRWQPRHRRTSWVRRACDRTGCVLHGRRLSTQTSGENRC